MAEELHGLPQPDPDGHDCWRKTSGELQCLKTAKRVDYAVLPPRGVNPAEIVAVYSCSDTKHQEQAALELEGQITLAVARRRAATLEAIERRRSGQVPVPDQPEGSVLSWVRADRRAAGDPLLGRIDDLLDELTG